MRLTVDIADTASWNTTVPALPALTRKVLRATLQFLDWPATLKTEVSVVFTTDARIQKLNREWRGKDKPTNVLSFPQLEDFNVSQPAPVHLGDIVVALQTVKREAKAQEKPAKAHVAHLLVHGMLHLLGYDHETGPRDAKRMEQTEIKIMRTLGYDNPYLNYDH